MRTDPLEISVVVPPGTDKRRLVATFGLNVEATITVISTGQRVVQENGVTRNDFSAPVLYAIEMPKEKKPWRYRVTVREAETNPRLAQLGFPEGSALTPAFNPQVKSYTVVVPFATSQVRIDARAESQYLKSISFDGAAAGGASAAGIVDFSTGQQRTVLIETLAEDGVSRDRYTLLVRRGAAGPQLPAGLPGGRGGHPGPRLLAAAHGVQPAGALRRHPRRPAGRGPERARRALPVDHRGLRGSPGTRRAADPGQPDGQAAGPPWSSSAWIGCR